jgi:hypothetical protein
MPNLSWDSVEPPDSATPPARPGMYAWLRDGEVVFMSAARSLRRRIQRELHGMDGRQLSPLRERVVLYLIREVRAAVPWRGAERRQAVDAWLRGCVVAWTVMPFTDAQEQVEEHLDAVQPLLDQWRPRPREDQWLASYLSRTPGGVVYTEVPIGGGPGSALRLIDAVRVCRDQPLDIRYFDTRGFARDRRAAALEIIEVKESLNRPVVGQLIVARDMIHRLWTHEPSIQFVAVVVRDDTLIHELCSELYDIRVEVVPRNTANTSP